MMMSPLTPTRQDAANWLIWKYPNLSWYRCETIATKCMISHWLLISECSHWCSQIDSTMKSNLKGLFSSQENSPSSKTFILSLFLITGPTTRPSRARWLDQNPTWDHFSLADIIFVVNRRHYLKVNLIKNVLNTSPTITGYNRIVRRYGTWGTVMFLYDRRSKIFSRFCWSTKYVKFHNAKKVYVSW